MSECSLFSSEKRSTLKGNNCLPLGAIVFPFRADIFQKGIDVYERKEEVTKATSLVKN